mgnify:FL=1
MSQKQRTSSSFSERAHNLLSAVELTLSPKNAHVEQYYQDIIKINAELAEKLAALKAGEKVNISKEMREYARDLEHILKDLHKAVTKDIYVGNHERALLYLRTYNQTAQTLESQKAQDSIRRAAQQIEQDLLGKRQKHRRKTQSRTASVRAAK